MDKQLIKYANGTKEVFGADVAVEQAGNNEITTTPTSQLPAIIEKRDNAMIIKQI